MLDQRRLDDSDSELDRKEIDWWNKYSYIEDKYSWTHDEYIRSVIRGRYLYTIFNYITDKKNILELGCGSGWLSREISKVCSGKIDAIDFSESQILLARQKAKEIKSISFYSSYNVLLGVSAKYDCIVTHAFLHHLTKKELSKFISDTSILLKPKGSIIIFEPVINSVEYQSFKQKIILKTVNILTKIPTNKILRKIIKYSSNETQHRLDLSARWVGILPLGPSPKEVPFSDQEINYYFEDFVQIHNSVGMLYAHCIVQEWLLMLNKKNEVSKFILNVVCHMASFLDSLLIKSNDLPNEQWVFRLMIWEKK
jgi:2-polyprenyl-3-methyl-5-hydroxy-6-metoxy-1,4-benzoquinol methylase